MIAIPNMYKPKGCGKCEVCKNENSERYGEWANMNFICDKREAENERSNNNSNNLFNTYYNYIDK